ncbi:hypothetical protein [Oceanobacillus sp. CFH 90083]|uniref:hypothetical protein n=1 Tax=Oceanobacillus sp. CFH 90083 TaxID=2592336 RepID=UPI001D148B89|nr:hypothetical protein [Oceanobacillus sp. CFH 90083]
MQPVLFVVFFPVGEINRVDTNPDLPGLHHLASEITDDVVKSFQDIAIQYAIGAKEGGPSKGIEAVIGVDLKLFDNDGFSEWLGFSHRKHE